MNTDTAKTVAQLYVTTRLDYCNSVLYGISDSLLCRLQSVATQLVTQGIMSRPHHSLATEAPRRQSLHGLARCTSQTTADLSPVLDGTDFVFSR